MWWGILGVVGYVLGGWVTLEFNIYLLREMAMVRTATVARNAILWPIFLPLLIWSSRR